MRAITVFGVLFAATTAWASSYETDDSDGLKKQCFLSTDFAHKADPGLKSISPPARFTVQRMGMEIAHEWIHEMFDRRDKFFAHEHQHGQQHGGKEDKHSGGHGTEEL
nr:hypothetical protein B0A51_00009 [Rachicladosporium sp. CCFEE 5018]